LTGNFVVGAAVLTGTTVKGLPTGILNSMFPTVSLACIYFPYACCMSPTSSHFIRSNKQHFGKKKVLIIEFIGVQFSLLRQNIFLRNKRCKTPTFCRADWQLPKFPSSVPPSSLESSTRLGPPNRKPTDTEDEGTMVPRNVGVYWSKRCNTPDDWNVYHPRHFLFNVHQSIILPIVFIVTK
jgi:hypothetical protein